MFLIFLGSTDAFSAEHTSRFLVPFLRWFDPEISFATIRAIHFAVRKAAHLTEYAILAAFLWRALRAGSLQDSWRSILAALAVAAAYAAFDEFHQSFVSTRTASENDVMIDICGAIVGVLLCWTFARKRVPARAPD